MSRLHPGTISVLLIGVDRPDLAASLAERGMVVSAADCSDVALIAEGTAGPAIPTLIEAHSAPDAGTLLDRGIADDVVLRSDPDILVAARLAALVRRARPVLVEFGDIVIDTVERSVVRGGGPLPLLPREYALLLYLARHGGAPVDHATLLRALWGRIFDPGTNVIAVHISRLRAKLAGGAVTVITVRGRGYRLAIAERPVAD